MKCSCSLLQRDFYVTVFQKHQRCLLADAWSTGKHLVIKREDRKCFLNVTTCSLIAGMFGCCCRIGTFHRGKQKMKETQAGCQNLPDGERAVLGIEQQGAVWVAVYWKWKEALEAWRTRVRDKTWKIKCWKDLPSKRLATCRCREMGHLTQRLICNQKIRIWGFWIYLLKYCT